MRFSLALGAISLLGALLRALRFPLRWNQIAFAYGAYQAPFEATVMDGQGLDALGTFFGLHPPLYSLAFAITHTAFGSMGAALGLSLLFSTLTIAAVGWLGREAFGERVGLGAGAMMAFSLYHLHYSLEVNNYPLFVLLTAISHIFFVRYLKGHSSVGWVISQSLVHWSHLLGGLLGAAQALGALTIASLRRHGLKALLWITLLTLPILPAVGVFLGNEGTYQNESLGAGALIGQLSLAFFERFGHPAGGGLLGIAASMGALRVGQRQPGLRLTRYFALGILIPALGIITLTALGVSAAHQHPYYLMLLPPLFVLAAKGVMTLPPPARALGLSILLIPNIGQSLHESRHGINLWDKATSTPHGLPGALKGIGDRGQPAALWLIAPALLPDDEKVAPDGAYAFIDPRWPCAFYRPPGVAFESTNFEQGQPYRCRLGDGPLEPGPGLAPGEFAFYTFTAIYPGTMPPLLEAHLLRGEPVEIVLYDTHASPGFLPALRRVLTASQEAQGAALIERQVGETWWMTLTPGEGPQ